MTKKDLIDTIAQTAELNKTQAAKVLDATLESITKSLKNKEAVTLVGFGTFSTADRLERPGKNPQTGAPITIPARTVAKFKAGKGLAEDVNS
ncbi:HU family DNA-binding protein [Desulfopila aestuarii]|uniref:DNA-binding protein HU-beta n=1 Tax=Desulfopila aestuarii DSM 18488 TaxID=1121416 RepID=A0A1M7YFV7_9BACT|nr:HU family DNA-binding protein [Desulfopila aestuarii]SHO51522.1 DNA-binding protein HU-beta [Desulfopila aestuarii DSM 18488]